MNSNYNANGEDLETGNSYWRRGVGRTKFVRDMTFKIIPFCCFSLVLFSIGAVLASTLAFNRPVPRRGTLVVSVLLLVFFGFFGIGFMYLYLRQLRLHGRNHSTAVSTQGSYSGSSSHSNLPSPFFGLLSLGFPRNDAANTAVQQGVNLNMGRSDILRDPAPTPNTYNRHEREQQEADRLKNAPRKPGEAARQTAQDTGQQQQGGHGDGEGGDTRQSAITQSNHLDLRPPNTGYPNFPVRAEDVPAPHQCHASCPCRAPLNPNARTHRESFAGRPPRGAAAQSLGGNANGVDPPRQARTYTSRWSSYNTYDQQRPPGPKPLGPRPLVPSLPTVPEVIVTRPSPEAQPGEGPTVPPEARPRNSMWYPYPPQGNSSTRPPVATPPNGPQKMNKVPQEAPGPPIAHTAPNPSSGFGSPIPRTRKNEIIKGVPKSQNYILPYYEPARESIDHEKSRTLEIASDTSTVIRHHIEPTPESPKLENDFSFDTAESVDGIHQDVIKPHSPIRTPTPIVMQDFIPRHPSALPEPLRLVDKTKRKGEGHISASSPGVTRFPG